MRILYKCPKYDEKSEWKKNRRFLVSLFKAVKRQKKKDERRRKHD